MRFKEYFEKLSLVAKLQWYFVVVAFFMISFTVMENFSPNTKTHKVQHLVPQSPKATKKPIPYIESLLQEYQLFLVSIHTNHQNISISLRGELIDIVNFLKQLESRTEVFEFTLWVENNLYHSKVVLEKQSSFAIDNTIKNLQTLHHPFVENNSIKTEELEKIPKKEIAKKIEELFSLEAIVSQSVFLNQQWYQKEDIIDGYKIEEVEPDFITLYHLDTKKIEKLRLDLDE